MLNFYQKKQLQLLKQVEGLSKIEIYDLIDHMEKLLLSVNSPIDIDHVQEKLDNEALSNVTIFNDYEYYYRLDSTTLLELYIRRSFNPLKILKHRLYFVSCFNRSPLPLSKRNIETTFKHTTRKQYITSFLEQYGTTSKNPISNRYRIIELFLSIEHEGLEELVNTNVINVK